LKFHIHKPKEDEEDFSTTPHRDITMAIAGFDFSLSAGKDKSRTAKEGEPAGPKHIPVKEQHPLPHKFNLYKPPPE